jgi:pimeloyl-ACP methyl ester carboxylesterase
MKKMFLLVTALFSPVLNADLLDEVTHGYADNNGVKIHYVKTGQGPLVVMIHGFPDYWYTWRQQINALKENFTVVAMDQRGYNLSGQPEGIAQYAMPNLVGDVAAVIKHQGASSATVVGHDWGGAVAWQVAFNLPQMVDNLVILNLPHPSGMAREMAINEEQQKNSGYARKFIAGSPTHAGVDFSWSQGHSLTLRWVEQHVGLGR